MGFVFLDGGSGGFRGCVLLPSSGFWSLGRGVLVWRWPGGLKYNMLIRSGLHFDLKHHILHESRTSAPFKQTFSIRELYKRKLQTNFDVNLISLLGIKLLTDKYL